MFPQGLICILLARTISEAEREILKVDILLCEQNPKCAGVLARKVRDEISRNQPTLSPVLALRKPSLLCSACCLSVVLDPL